MTQKNRGRPKKDESLFFEILKKISGYISKDKKQLTILIICAYVANKLSYIYGCSEGQNAVKKIMDT